MARGDQNVPEEGPKLCLERKNWKLEMTSQTAGIILTVLKFK